MRSFFFFLLLNSALAIGVSAQTAIATPSKESSGSEVHRIELGSTVSYINTDRTLDTCSSPHWSFGPEATVNFNHSLAVDGQLHFLAGSSSCLNYYKGGHAIEGLIGPRFSIRDGNVRYFATIKPGFIRWDRALTDEPFSSPSDAKFEPRTMLAVHFGGGVDYPVGNLRMRAELGDTVIRNPRSGSSFYRNNLQVIVGAHYSFGTVLPRRESLAPNPDTHKFFDKTNIALTTLAWSGIAADAIETQRMFKGCPTASCRSLLEGNPLARPFVKYGWSGQVAFSGIAAGSELFLAHRLHRSGHHKLERILPIAVAITGGVMAYRNADRPRAIVR